MAHARKTLRRALLKFSVAAVGWPVAVGVAQTAPTPVAPPYTPARYDENYVYLRDTPGTDYLDALKFIQLGGDAYLSLGGQLRGRYEYINNPNFGAGISDEDGYFLSRVTNHADLHLNQNFRAFVQGKGAYEDGREGIPRTTDRDEYDLQQAFVDLSTPLGTKASTTLRVGRQALLYGSQRLVGMGDWTNTQRAFDGARLITDFKAAEYSNRLELLLTRPVAVSPTSFNEGDGTQTFWGLYDTVGLPRLFGCESGTTIDFYFLGLNQQPNADVRPLRISDADIYTLGTRIAMTPRPWDFEAELDYQFGMRGEQDISAYSLSAVAGYRFGGVSGEPRVFAGFDYASGDSSASDHEYNTFNPLFPTGHRFFGDVDVIGRSNIISPNVGVEVTLVQNASWAQRLGLRVQYLAFWKADDADNIYVAGNTPLLRPGNTSDTFIGNEIDLMLNWQVDRHLSFQVGYGHLFAGEAIHNSSAGNNGLARDIDFAYAAAAFTF